MNKTLLLMTASFLALNTANPVFAATKSDNKMCKKVGHAVMWGPKKVASGFSWAGKKISGK